MADGDEVDVVVKDGEGAGEGDKPVVAETLKGKTLEEQLAEAKVQLDSERQARHAAEQRAHEATGRVALSEEEIRKSHITTMDSAIQILDQTNDQLEADLAAAMAEGDHARGAKISRAMGVNTAKRLEIERGKLMAETAPVRRNPAPPEVGTPSNEPAVEAVAATLTPRSRDWVRAHPEFARTPAAVNKMKAAHFKVISELGDEKAETPEYFAAVEAELGVSGGVSVKANGDAAGEHGVNVTVSDAAKPVQARQSGTGEREVQPSPAPANAGGLRTRTVRLTPAEQEAAKMSGLTNEEYAKNKLVEVAKGNIGKQVH